MAVRVTLEEDEALVLFDLLASGRLKGSVEAPERNVLWRLESALENQLIAPFLQDYEALLDRARASLVKKFDI